MENNLIISVSSIVESSGKEKTFPSVVFISIEPGFEMNCDNFCAMSFSSAESFSFGLISFKKNSLASPLGTTMQPILARRDLSVSLSRRSERGLVDTSSNLLKLSNSVFMEKSRANSSSTETLMAQPSEGDEPNGSQDQSDAA